MINFFRGLLIKLLMKLVSPYVTLTAVSTVDLYYDNDNLRWVFDDPSKGIVAEGFSSGIGQMIDQIIQHQWDEFSKGCRLSFSTQPFPDYQAMLTWEKNEDFGNWYTWDGIRGWLCPVLGQYYQIVPQYIFVKIERKPA